MLLALMVSGCHGVCAESDGNISMTESQKQGAVFSEDLSIPSPGEVFVALNTPCHPNWVTLVTPAMAPVTTDRAQLALAVGVLAANGYIAVEAQDGQQVKNIGREMITVAKALGVSENLMGRGSSLIEFAEDNEWDSLAAELEATENEIKTTMREQKDHDLIILTSVAAWLRGVEVATQIVLSDPKLEGVSVIRQPDLAHHLVLQLNTLPTRMQNKPLVSKVQNDFTEIVTLLDSMGTTPESERPKLQQIHDSAAALVREILASSDNHAVPSPSPLPLKPTQEGSTNP